MSRLLANQKLGFTKPLETFNSLLQKGYFSVLYGKEREIESKLSRFNYSQAILDNLEPSEIKKQPQKKTHDNSFLLNFSSSMITLIKILLN